MTVKDKNQNDIMHSDLINSFEDSVKNLKDLDILFKKIEDDN